MVLKPLQDSFLSNYTSKNLAEDHNYELTSYLLITLYAPLWIYNITLLQLITLSLLIPLPIDSVYLSKSI